MPVWSAHCVCAVLHATAHRRTGGKKGHTARPANRVRTHAKTEGQLRKTRPYFPLSILGKKADEPEFLRHTNRLWRSVRDRSGHAVCLVCFGVFQKVGQTVLISVRGRVGTLSPSRVSPSARGHGEAQGFALGQEGLEAPALGARCCCFRLRRDERCQSFRCN